MVFFGATYLLRFMFDLIVVPDQINIDDVCYPEIKDFEPSYCPTFAFTMSYVCSAILWDYLPIGLIVIFHFKSFRAAEEARNGFDDEFDDLFSDTEDDLQPQ